MKIKLCGFKNQESVSFALKYQPDFIGFIFYPPSKRNIELEKAKELSEINFGKTKKIAVIVNASDEYISKIIKNLNPDLLQLHGGEDIARCRYIKNKFNLPIVKSIAVADNSNSKEIQNLVVQYNQIADFFLFDTKTSQKGGSGINFDWQILKNLSLPNEYFLSGGVNIDNIKKASLISNNIILDLSSGIEKKKGIKSLDKIKELMDFVKLNI